MVAALMVCMSTALAAGSAGSSDDPLISKSYIDGTYAVSVKSSGEASVANVFSQLAESEQSSLNQAQSALAAGLDAAPAGFSFAPGYTALTLSGNSMVYMITGGSFILSSGSVSVTIASGTVVNASTGETVSSGSALTAGQRYFCAENTSVTYVSSAAGSCMADGYYTTGRNFDDVSRSSWYYSFVQFVCAHGMFSGMSETVFAPETGMTRAMLVTVLYNLEGKPSVTAANPFSDVASGLWYTAPVTWAGTNNIVSGYGGGLFGPDDRITREQISMVLYKYAAYKGFDTSGSADLGGYSDADGISSWAIRSMSWANACGIINGTPDNQLMPKKTATRAEVATMLTNFYNKFM